MIDLFIIYARLVWFKPRRHKMPYSGNFFDAESSGTSSSKPLEIIDRY